MPTAMRLYMVLNKKCLNTRQIVLVSAKGSVQAFLRYVRRQLLSLPVLLLILACPVTAHADWFYRLVGFTCDQSLDRLTVRYKGEYNEAGIAMQEEKTATEWSPDSLIASMKDDDHIGELKTIEAICKLRHATYQVRIGPTPGNFNVQGRCGAIVTAWVQVRKGRRVILPRYELEGDCHDTESPVTTEIIFAAHSVGPVFKKVSQEDFFR